MFNSNKNKDQNKSRVLELKADKLAGKGKLEKAFKIYQQALMLDPERLALYDKIITIHEEHQDDWDEEDFAFNVALTMQKQEITDPAYKRIHARLTPEFKEIAELIKKMLNAKTHEDETKFAESIWEKGDDALYPLIDYILGFKEMSKKNAEKLKQSFSKKTPTPHDDDQ